MAGDSFSVRHGYELPNDQFIYEDAPESALEAVWALLEQILGDFDPQLSVNSYAKSVATGVAQRFGLPQIFTGYALSTFRRLFGYSSLPTDGLPAGVAWQWTWFYDLCQYAYHEMARPDNERFQMILNTIFQREGIGWELRGGFIERRTHPNTAEQLEKARQVLSDARFSGANQHLAKAMEHWSRRPEPDFENCVKDAVAACESVVRVVLNKPSIQLNQGIDELARQNRIPQPLDQVIAKLYAYRGSAPGVAHGAPQQGQVGAEEAEFVLATSASAVVYLSKVSTR